MTARARVALVAFYLLCAAAWADAAIDSAHKGQPVGAACCMFGAFVGLAALTVLDWSLGSRSSS